jgi:DNA-directed RNA polymerase specialized sigma subunit
MAMIERINGYRREFRNRYGRDPTAKEIAEGLHVDIARPDTIRKAIEAQGPKPTKAIEHVYNLTDRQRDHQRCVQTLQQLQSSSPDARRLRP